jgi:hypothetical protein
MGSKLSIFDIKMQTKVKAMSEGTGVSILSSLGAKRAPFWSWSGSAGI